MTIHLKRINRFGGDSGGGGGGVDVVETTKDFFLRIGHSTSYSQVSSCARYCFIDDSQYIFYYAPYPSGTPTVTISTIKVWNENTISVTQNQSVNFDFGQTYSSQLNFNNRVAVSPDKTKAVLLWGSNKYKITIMPLVNTNGTYTFGTFVTSDTPDLSNQQIVRFVNNDTFVVVDHGTDSKILYAYKIQSDNTVTLLTTFTNSEVITGMITMGETIMIANTNTNTVWVLDNIIDQNIIYTEVLSGGTIALSNQYGRQNFVLDNRFYIYNSSSSSQPFYIFELNNGTITKLSFTSSLSNIFSGYLNTPIVIRNENNVVIMALPAVKSNYSQLISVEIDFNNLTMKEAGIVINNYNLYYSNFGAGSAYYDRTNSWLYVFTNYSSSYENNTFQYSPNEIPYKVNLDGWQYTLSNKVSS